MSSISEQVRPWRFVLLLVAVFVLVGARSSSDPLLDGPSPEIVLLGEVVTVEDGFSLRTLVRPSERAEVEAVRRSTFHGCLADRGFTEPPTGTPDDVGFDHTYAEAYHRAAFGSASDDVTSVIIALPNGEHIPFGASWTPEGCWWRSYEVLGSHPFQKEAMALKLGALANQGDSIAAGWLGGAAERCGLDDGQDLVDIVNAQLANDPLRFGFRLANACDEVADEVARTMSRAHLTVTAQDGNDLVVDAYAQLLNDELAAARSS